MAITAAPYGKFLMGLGNGNFNFSADTIRVGLYTASYTPNQNTDEFLSTISAYEVSTSGTNYAAVTLTGVTWTYDTVNKRGILGASPVTFTGVTLSTRFAVVYKSTGVAGTSRLISWLDFGATKTYSGEDIQLSFVSGVTRVKAV